jgi:acylphosphatase
MTKVGLDIVRRGARVHGRVQGVSYRAATLTEARRLGVVGWVRNRADGSVELEAEGPDDAVRALLAWCQHGPPAARVTRIEAEPLTPLAGETTFSVRY